jgi:putative ABC transport system permease protein
MFAPEAVIERLREGITLALDQLMANKFRSALTILGIVIGVATVMIMSAVVTGVRSEAMEGINAAGPKNFIVARWDYSNIRVVSDGDGPPWGNNPKVNLRELRELERLPAIKRVIAALNTSGEIKGPGAPVDNVNVLGRGAGWEAFTTGTFTAGHNYLGSDVAASRPVVVFSKALADQIFGSLDPVGRTVRINSKPFQVIGVIEIEGNIFGDASRHFAIIPHTAAIKYLKAWDGMMEALVVTDDDATQDRAMDQVITAMRTMRGLRPAEPNDFAVIRQEALLDMFNQLTGVFFAVMIGLSSVALLVGGVGVIAIMMISVSERTREIGVRKAIGARRREILWQFLVEAVTLTLAGAVIGMIFGGLIAWIVQAATPVPASVPLSAVLAALAMATVAGVVFGMLPAWRASRLDPVEALRYE